MSVRGVKCIRGFIDMSEHLRCQREETPPCLIPPTILRMIVEPNAEREALNIEFSPSSLSSCHRRSVLSKDNDYFVDVAATYKMVRGSIFHQGLEQEPPPPGTLGVVRELRMSAPIKVNGKDEIFWGKADEVTLLAVDGGVLHVAVTDYKTKAEVGHDLIEADREHTVQINQYSWLVQKFLPGWLYSRGSAMPGTYGDNGEMQLTTGLPRIDEVVVDELKISYMDMSRVRTFTSRGFSYDRGKQLGDRDENGRWVKRYPIEYEELELSPLHQFQPHYVEELIRNGIASQIEAETLLAPPLHGDAARLQCGSCAVRDACIDIGRQEGRDMSEQLVYSQRGR